MYPLILFSMPGGLPLNSAALLLCSLFLFLCNCIGSSNRFGNDSFDALQCAYIVDHRTSWRLSKHKMSCWHIIDDCASWRLTQYDMCCVFFFHFFHFCNRHIVGIIDSCASRRLTQYDMLCCFFFSIFQLGNRNIIGIKDFCTSRRLTQYLMIAHVCIVDFSASG